MVGAQAREEYARAVAAMAQKLRAAQYNGSYFDRGAKAGGRLCTPEGWFSCQVSGCPFPGPQASAELPSHGGGRDNALGLWPAGLGP